MCRRRLAGRDNPLARHDHKTGRIERHKFACRPDAGKVVRPGKAVDVGEESPKTHDVRAVIKHVVEAARGRNSFEDRRPGCRLPPACPYMSSARRP